MDEIESTLTEVSEKIDEKLDNVFVPRNRAERRKLEKMLHSQVPIHGSRGEIKEAVKRATYADAIQKLRNYYKEHEEEIKNYDDGE